MNLVYIGVNRLHRNRANLIQTLHTTSAFGALGISTRLFLPPWKSGTKLANRLEELGINGSINIISSQLLHSRWKFLEYKLFIKAYGSEIKRADAVYTRSPELSLALGKAGIEHVLEVHDFDDLVKLGYINDLINNHKRGTISWLIPISNAAATSLIEAGALPERIHVSPSGVDYKKFERITPFNPNQLVPAKIIYIGQISQDHGIDIFINIAEKCNARITLIGNETGEFIKKKNILIKSFIPHREVPYWYEKSSIIVLPYKNSLQHINSISPMKLFEALASGRPIITSNLPAIREIVTHNENAILVDPDKPDLWIEAVNKLQGNPELSVKLSASAKALAAKYDWSQRARNIATHLGWL